MQELVTLGETMVLFTPFNSNGRIKSSGSLVKNIGGSESNVAIGISRLGHSAAWISRIGKDPFGEEILYRLNAERVNTSNVSVETRAGTGIMFKERIRGGQPSVYYYRNSSAATYLSKTDIDEDLIKKAKILHVTGITPALSPSCFEVVLHAISVAKKHGVKVSFDPNLRLKLWSIENARATLLPIAEQADLFFPGLEEARQMLNNDDLTKHEVVSAFLDMGIQQVILKLGPEGCITANQSQQILSKGFQVNEIDAVGAGDGFCAGYLAGVLKGWQNRNCAELANATGALAVTEVGDCDALPTLEEVEQFMGLKAIVRR
jgi:2-dehydro-3-deoxygluconokinase